MAPKLTDAALPLLDDLKSLPAYNMRDDDFIVNDIRQVLESDNDEWKSALVNDLQNLPGYNQRDSAFVVNDLSEALGFKQDKGFWKKMVSWIPGLKEKKEEEEAEEPEETPAELPSALEERLGLEPAKPKKEEKPPAAAPTPEPTPEPAPVEGMAAAREALMVEQATAGPNMPNLPPEPVELPTLVSRRPGASTEPTPGPAPVRPMLEGAPLDILLEPSKALAADVDVPRPEPLEFDVPVEVTKYKEGEEHPSLSATGRAWERIQSWFPQASSVATRTMADEKEVLDLEQDVEQLQRGRDKYEELHGAPEVPKRIPFIEEAEEPILTDQQRAMIGLAFDKDRQWIGDKIPVLTEEEKQLKGAEREDLMSYFLEVGRLRSNIIAGRWQQAQAGAAERVERLDPLWLQTDRVATAISELENTENLFVRALRQGNVATMTDHMGFRALTEGTPEAARQALNLRLQFSQVATAQDESSKQNAFERTFFSAVEMLPSMGKGMALGAIPAVGTALSNSFWATQGAGGLYLDLIEQGVPVDIARTAAINTGVLYAAIEQQQAGQLLQAGGQGILSKLLKNTVAKKIAGEIADKGLDYIMEVGEEVLQEIVLTAGEDAARTRAGMEINLGEGEQSWKDKYWRIAKETAAQTAGPMAITQAGFGLGGRGVRAARQGAGQLTQAAIDRAFGAYQQGRAARAQEVRDALEVIMGGGTQEAPGAAPAPGQAQPGEGPTPGTAPGTAPGEAPGAQQPTTQQGETVSVNQGREEIVNLEDLAKQTEQDKADAENSEDPQEQALVVQDQAYERVQDRLGAQMGEAENTQEIWDRGARIKKRHEARQFVSDQQKQEAGEDLDGVLSLTRDGVMLDDNGVGMQGRKAMDDSIDERYRTRDKFGEFSIGGGDIQNVNGMNEAFGHEGTNYVMRRLGNTVRKFLAPIKGMPFRIGGDELNTAADGDKQILQDAVDKIEQEHNTWVESVTLGQVAKEAGIKLREGFDPDMKLADLPHPKHDGMPTGGGRIHFAVRNSSLFDDRSQLLKAVDDALEVRNLQRLQEKQQKLVDENGVPLYNEVKEGTKTVFRRRTDGQGQRQAPGPGGPGTQGAPGEAGTEPGPGDGAGGEATARQARLGEQLERAREAQAEYNVDSLSDALQAVEAQDQAKEQGQALSFEDALAQVRAEAEEPTFEFSAEAPPKTAPGVPIPGFTTKQWQKLDQKAQDDAILTFNSRPEEISREDWNAMKPQDRADVLQSIEDYQRELDKAEQAESPNEKANILITDILNRLYRQGSFVRVNKKTKEIKHYAPGGWNLKGKDWDIVRNNGSFDDLSAAGKEALTEELRKLNSSEESRQILVDAGLLDEVGNELEMDDFIMHLSSGVTKGEFDKGARGRFQEEQIPGRKPKARKEAHPTDKNMKEPEQSQEDQQQTHNLQSVRLAGTLERLGASQESMDKQRILDDEMKYSLGGYAEGRGKPAMVGVPELVELVKFLQGALPNLRRRINRKFSVAGGFSEARRAIFLRRDIFRGPVLAELDGSRSFLERARMEIVNDLVMAGMNPDDIDVVIEPIRGGRKLRMTVYRLDPSYAGKVIAHELGHFIDFIAEDPDLQKLARGNILGKIATLSNYLKETIPQYPGGMENVTEEEKDEIYAAAKQLVGRGILKEVDEEIRTTLDVTPEMITGILGNSTEDLREKYPELYDYIARLDRAEKKAILVKVLRDKIVPEELQEFAKSVTVKTGRKTTIIVPPGKEAFMEKFNELLRDELRRRQVVERAVIMDELQRLTQKWRPFDEAQDPDYTDYRYEPDELYADAISVLMNDPDLLMEVAPVFYKSFFYYAPRKGKVAQLWLSIQKDLEKDGLLNRRARSLRKMFEDDAERELGVRFSTEMEDKTGDHSRKFESNLLFWIDKNMKLIRQKARAMRRGMTLKPQDDPQYAVQKYGRSTSIQRAHAYRMQDWKRRAEKDGVTIDDVAELAFEERIMLDPKRGVIANPLGFTPEVSAEQREALREKIGDEKFQKVQQYLDEFRQIRFNTVVPAWIKSGMLSPAQAKYVKQNKAYVTFNVLDHLEKRYGSASSVVTYRKSYGTLSQIENPISATIANDLAIIRAVERAKSWQVYKRFIRNATIGGYLTQEDQIEKMSDYKDRPGAGLGKVVVEENGELVGYLVPETIAKVWDNDPFLSQIVTDVLSVPSKINNFARAAYVTKSIAFALTNFVRDYRRTARNAPGMVIPASHWFKLMPQYFKAMAPVYRTIFGQTPDAEIIQMLDRGQLFSVTSIAGLDSDSKQLERTLAKFKVNNELETKGMNPVARAGDIVTTVNEAIELLGKVAAKKYMDQYAKDWAPEKKDDYIAGKLGSPDYSRGGLGRFAIANMFLFFNPQKEGLRADAEVLRERPIETTVKMIKGVVAPTLLTYALLKGAFKKWFEPDDDDDEEWAKEKGAIYSWLSWWEKALKSVPLYDLHNYGIIPLCELKDGSIVYLRIPQDETDRFVRGLVWGGLEASGGAFDPADLADIVNYMADQIPSPAPALGLPADVYRLGTGQNVYDTWYDRFAIPEQYEKGSFSKTRGPIAVSYLWNKYGGRTLYKADPTKRPLWGVAPWTKSSFEKKPNKLEQIFDVPYLGPIVNRFVKIVDPYQGEAARIGRKISRPLERKVHDERWNRMVSLTELFDKYGDDALNLDHANEAWEKLYGDWKGEGPPPVSAAQFRNTWQRIGVKRYGSAWEKTVLHLSYRGHEIQQAILEGVKESRMAEEREKRKLGEPYLTDRQVRDEVDAMRSKMGLYGQLMEGIE